MWQLEVNSLSCDFSRVGIKVTDIDHFYPYPLKGCEWVDYVSCWQSIWRTSVEPFSSNGKSSCHFSMMGNNAYFYFPVVVKCLVRTVYTVCLPFSCSNLIPWAWNIKTEIRKLENSVYILIGQLFVLHESWWVWSAWPTSITTHVRHCKM